MIISELNMENGFVIKHSKYILFIFWIATFMLGSCKIKKDERCKNSHPSLSTADSLLYLGEEQIIEHNFEKASDYFLALFDLDHYEPKSKDFYNGFLASLEVEDYEKATLFLSRIVQLGFDVDKLKDNDRFIKYTMSSLFMSYHENKYLDDIAKFKKHFNEALFYSVVKLVNIDQKEYCGIDGLSPQLTDSISHFFIEYLSNEKALPSERELGCCYTQDGFPNLMPVYTPLIIHAGQNGHNEFIDIIFNSVTKGSISSDLGYFYLSFFNSILIPDCQIIEVDGKNFRKILSKEESESDCQIRAKLGLYNSEHILNRLFYFDKDYLFLHKVCRYDELNAAQKKQYELLN